MTLSTIFFDLPEFIVRSLWHSSLQLLLPLCIVLIFDVWQNSVRATTKCCIYRGLFFKILFMTFIPFSIPLPVLPATDQTLVLHESRRERVLPTHDTVLTTSVVDTKQFRTMEETSADTVSTGTLLFLAWLAGVGLIVWRTVCEHRLGKQYVRLGRNPDHENLWVSRICRELASRMGLKKCPELRVTQSNRGPMLIGVLRPVILIPQWLLESEVDLRLALAHELAHCRRHDLAWNALIRLMESLFFFHPLVWWSIRRYHVAVEIACDQSAIQSTGESRRVYGELLLQSMQSCPLPRPKTSFSLALTPFTCLKERLMAIGSNSNSNRKRPRSAAVLAIIVVTALFAPPVSLAQQRISKSKGVSSGGGGSSKSGSFSSGSSSSSATASGIAFSSGSAGGNSDATGFGGGDSNGLSDGSRNESRKVDGTVRSGGSKTATARSQATTDIPADATKTDNPADDILVDPRVAKPNVQTKRSISIHDGETLIEISEAPGKIRVRVTKSEDDSEDVTIYAAKNLEDLRKNSPKGYELFEKYLLEDEKEVDATGQMEGARKKFDDVVSDQQKMIEQHKRQFDERVRKQREELDRFAQQMQKNQKNSIKVLP